MENVIYFAVMQRSLNRHFIQVWFNGSDRRELMTEKSLLNFIEKDYPLLIPALKQSVLLNTSLYLVNFINQTIRLLSASDINNEMEISEALTLELNLELTNREDAKKSFENFSLNFDESRKERQSDRKEKIINAKQAGPSIFRTFIKNLKRYIR